MLTFCKINCHKALPRVRFILAFRRKEPLISLFKKREGNENSGLFTVAFPERSFSLSHPCLAEKANLCLRHHRALSAVPLLNAHNSALSSVCPVCLSPSLSPSMSPCLSVFMPVCVCLSACLYLSACLSVGLSICLSASLSVCLSACLSVCHGLAWDS